jgi:uncharacterized protein (DUF433 family)
MKNDTNRITKNPKQCGSHPCIRGMKIQVSDILDLLGKGLTFEAILDALPTLEKEDIVAAIAYASTIVNHPINTTGIDINASWQGWWVYEQIEHWVSDRQKTLTENSKCLVWTNLILIKARNRHDAYRKAMKSCENYPIKTNGGEWRFSGIMWLGPVQDLMGDGAELIWSDRGQMRVKNIAKLVKSKEQLAVFNDHKTPPKLNPALFI